MTVSSDPLVRIQARRWLEEINQHILYGEGEIIDLPGKVSLVWTLPGSDFQRYLAIKPAGDSEIYINSRRFPATEDGVKKGLLEILSQNR